jgi:hypothetical protein
VETSGPPCAALADTLRAQAAALRAQADAIDATAEALAGRDPSTRWATAKENPLGSTRSVLDAARRGAFPTYKRGREVVARWADVESFIMSRPCERAARPAKADALDAERAELEAAGVRLRPARHERHGGAVLVGLRTVYLRHGLLESRAVRRVDDVLWLRATPEQKQRRLDLLPPCLIRRVAPALKAADVCHAHAERSSKVASTDRVLAAG